MKLYVEVNGERCPDCEAEWIDIGDGRFTQSRTKLCKAHSKAGGLITVVQPPKEVEMSRSKKREKREAHRKESHAVRLPYSGRTVFLTDEDYKVYKKTGLVPPDKPYTLPPSAKPKFNDENNRRWFPMLLTKAGKAYRGKLLLEGAREVARVAGLKIVDPKSEPVRFWRGVTLAALLVSAMFLAYVITHIGG